MKIGLIARSEYARGLAIQSKNFYDHMPVERVLLVHMPQPDCALADGWYPGARIIDSLPGHTLHKDTVMDWMRGLDVVFTVETPYDWDLPNWARDIGVKTVIQGNPEFVRHHQPDYAHFAHPDQWWWPTSWRLNHLPAGVVMPVPMPDHEPTAADPYDGPLRMFHVAGKRAFADRNGTDTVIDALRGLHRGTMVKMHGLDHSLPEIAAPMGVNVDVERVGVKNLWDMYVGQHLLVLPRRYGGLCLPALEAASRGVAVMMTDCSPNHELASVLVPSNVGRRIRVACGELMTADVHHYALGQEINALDSDRDALAAAMQRSWEMVPRWSEWRDRYLEQFARLL